MHQSHDARAALRQRLPEPRLERADHRAPNHPPLPSGSGSGSHAAAGQHLPAELILERAQAVDPTFQLTPINAQAVAEICMQVDGLPLALELAAARIKVLPPQALLARLTERFTLLTGGSHALSERQQTLRNTLAWSYGPALSPGTMALSPAFGLRRWLHIGSSGSGGRYALGPPGGAAR